MLVKLTTWPIKNMILNTGSFNFFGIPNTGRIRNLDPDNRTNQEPGKLKPVKNVRQVKII